MCKGLVRSALEEWKIDECNAVPVRKPTLPELLNQIPFFATHIFFATATGSFKKNIQNGFSDKGLRRVQVSMDRYYVTIRCNPCPEAAHGLIMLAIHPSDAVILIEGKIPLTGAIRCRKLK